VLDPDEQAANWLELLAFTVLSNLKLKNRNIEKVLMTTPIRVLILEDNEIVN